MSYKATFYLSSKIAMFVDFMSLVLLLYLHSNDMYFSFRATKLQKIFENWLKKKVLKTSLCSVALLQFKAF